jgi:hypothetical protein
VAIPIETRDLPAAGNLFKAFDDACSVVLNQLQEDLKLLENEARRPFDQRLRAADSRFRPETLPAHRARRDGWTS